MPTSDPSYNLGSNQIWQIAATPMTQEHVLNAAKMEEELLFMTLRRFVENGVHSLVCESFQ